MDGRGLGSLCLVAAEWLTLGWLAGVDWPPAPPTSEKSFWAARWALRLLVGSCLTVFAQLGLAMAGPGFATIPLVLACAAVGATTVRIVQRGLEARADAAVSGGEAAPAMAWSERAGWLVLGLVLVCGTARSLLVPEAGWDAFSHWGLRAQAYAIAGTIVDAHSEHDYYPPLIPLLEAWLYLHRGQVAIDLGKTISALIGSAFGVCLAWHLRLSLASPWRAPWLATGIVVGTTALLENFWTGQADLALTAYFSLAALAVLQWQRAWNRSWLAQAALFAAAAALTKFEGLPRIGVVAAVLLLETRLIPRRATQNASAALVLAAAAGFASVAWTAFEATHAISANPEHLGPFQPQAMGSVLIALLAVFGGIRTAGAVVIACLAWVVAGRCLFAAPLRVITVVVLGELAATLAGFLLNSTSPAVEVRTSATRLFEHFLPLALFAGAVGISKVRL